MDVSTLDFKVLHRNEERNGDHISRHETFSCDFLIDGISLLDLLVKASDGHSDFLGCFARGWDRLNEISESDLLVKSKVQQQSGRVLLYLCPECGDIACGAFGAKVSKVDGHYIWQDFAYENSYEKPIQVSHIGPFRFDASSYEKAIFRATSL
jgi:hypothetical protein